MAPLGFRLLAALLSLGLLALHATPARACNTLCDDASGVVALPAGADISLPFAKGEKVLVTSGYGPTGGSTGHCRSQDAQCANDYFALDLVLPNHPTGGLGQPVLAAADGTVIDAAWATDGWASYGQRIYIQHDFGDGHAYTTVYAHLDSIKVTKGQSVKKGDPIGTLGHSSDGIQANPNMGAHLHFSIHRDASFGGSGSGGSYAGRAVRPEPLDGSTGIAKGQTLTSNNGGAPPPPPPSCDIVVQPTGETVIEDTSDCVEKLGTLLESTSGSGGHAFHSVLDNADPDYAEGAFWNLTFAQPGVFDVYAWIPNGIPNLTSQAVYKTQHAGTASFVTLDQAAEAGGWTLLGSHEFAASGEQWVRLGDNYASAASKGKTFVIDALKLAPASSGSGGQGGTAAGGSVGTGASAGAAGSGGSGGSIGAGGAAATPASEDDLGCACRLPRRTPNTGAFAVAGLVVAAVGAGRLRRRRRGLTKAARRPSSPSCRRRT